MTVCGGTRFLIWRQLGVDLRNDVQSGGVTGFVDGHDHAALSVHPRDIDLRRKAVADVGHILHVDRGTVRGSDGYVIERGQGIR